MKEIFAMTLRERAYPLPEYLVITYKWLLERYGNPCLLTKSHLAELDELKAINKRGYDVVIATIKFDSRLLVYEDDINVR